MPWQPSLNALRDALADLYDNEADARRIARSAGLPLSRLSLGGGPRCSTGATRRLVR